MRHILSIDGGGIRGIIPCCALVELERQTGKLTREMFDFVAGTSTGALLTAAVAAGIPAKDILPIYTERAPKEIFIGAMRTARMVAVGYRYDSVNIAKVLRSALGTAASWKLNDCPVRVLITAMHVSWKPMYFVQDRPGNAKTTGLYSLVDCAVASASAPTYFDPWYVSPAAPGTKGPFGNELVGWCFDGGTGVLANPVHRACVEAFKYDDLDPSNAKVISLGTGFYNDPKPDMNPPNGLLPTISWTINSLLGAAFDEQAALVEDRWPGIMNRLNPPLPRAIDEADMSAIPDLVQVGQAAAKKIDWAQLLS